MISSATALVYFKSAGRPFVLHVPNGAPRAVWGMSDVMIMRWFGAHGFRVDWTRGPSVITEGRGALQRYIQTWVEIGAVQRVELIDENYNLTKGVIWNDLKGWEIAKLNSFQKAINEESK